MTLKFSKIQELDLTVMNVYNGDFSLDFEYTKIPTDQVGDLTFGNNLG